jgi:membrane associated rhomboid family serine protease
VRCCGDGSLSHHDDDFTPQSAAVPALGASGAIAGVLGLFAMRFYRTPVRIFFFPVLALWIVGALWA